jgi:hypothetical protein
MKFVYFRPAAALVALCFLPVVAFAQSTEPNAASKSEQKPAAAVKAPAPAVNEITQAAVKSGVLSCASRVNQVSSFLTTGNKTGVFLFTPADNPDQRVFSASMEVTTPNGQANYASTSFAPNQANGCGALYETVSFEPNRCEEVATKQFPGSVSLGKLGATTIILGIGPSARVFLMPASDKGCIVIKKEVMS